MLGEIAKHGRPCVRPGEARYIVHVYVNVCVGLMRFIVYNTCKYTKYTTMMNDRQFVAFQIPMSNGRDK